MKHNYYTPYGIPSATQGHRPWNGDRERLWSAGSSAKPFLKGDGPAEIQACLSCPKSECSNCLGERRKTLKSDQTIPASFLFDALSGWSNSKLSKTYHIGKNTVAIWKHTLGIEKPPKGAGAPSGGKKNTTPLV